MIQLGTIVSIQDSSRYGVVTEIFPYGDTMLYHVHYIDPGTGKLLECADSRCHGEHTCPIHGQNCTTKRIRQIPKGDTKVLIEAGMLDPELLSSSGKEKSMAKRKLQLSAGMIAFLQAEIHNCLAPNGSGQPTTLETARGSLSQMPEEVLLGLLRCHDKKPERVLKSFYAEFDGLFEKLGPDHNMAELV